MKLMYIAGKYSGKNWYEIDLNIKKAKEEALKVIKKGWFPITPHLNTAHFEEYEKELNVNYDFWIKGTLKLLDKCDAVYFIKNWEGSSGSIGECKRAEKNNMNRYFSYEEIPNLRKNK